LLIWYDIPTINQLYLDARMFTVSIGLLTIFFLLQFLPSVTEFGRYTETVKRADAQNATMGRKKSDPDFQFHEKASRGLFSNGQTHVRHNTHAPGI
jgi:hypothetical protein